VHLAALLAVWPAAATAQPSGGWVRVSGVSVHGPGLTEPTVLALFAHRLQPRLPACMEAAGRTAGRSPATVQLTIAVDREGRSSLLNLVGAGMNEARSCVERAVAQRLRFASDEARPARAIVQLRLQHGGPGVDLPGGERTPTRCDRALRRAGLPLASCGNGAAAPQALMDEVRRMLEHALARANPRYGGGWEGDRTQRVLRELSGTVVSTSGAGRVIAIRYVIETTHEPGHGGDGCPGCYRPQAEVVCLPVRFRGPQRRLRMQVPRCLPGLDPSVVPLTRPFAPRASIGSGERGGVAPFRPAALDLR